MVGMLDHDVSTNAFIMPPEQGRAFFDREARRVTGLSGDDFLRRYDAGEIVEDDETSLGREVMYVIMLISFGRPNP